MYDIAKDLQSSIDRTKKLLEKLEATLAFAEKGEFQFRVTLHSAWSDYGEKNAVGVAATLEEADRKAEEEFKRINNRTDVQASGRFVAVVFSNDFTFRPHEFY